MYLSLSLQYIKIAQQASRNSAI